MRFTPLLCILAAVALLLPLCFVAAADVEAPVATDGGAAAAAATLDAPSPSPSAVEEAPTDVISWMASLPNLPLLVLHLPFDLVTGSLRFVRHFFLEDGWRSWFGSAYTTHWSGAVFNFVLQVVTTFAVARHSLESASTLPAGTGMVSVPTASFATGLSDAVLVALVGVGFVYHVLGGCGWAYSLASWTTLWTGFGWAFLQEPCDARTVRAYRRGTNIVGAVVIAMVTATRTKETGGINAVFLFLLVGNVLYHFLESRLPDDPKVPLPAPVVAVVEADMFNHNPLLQQLHEAEQRSRGTSSSSTGATAATTSDFPSSTAGTTTETGEDEDGMTTSPLIAAAAAAAAASANGAAATAEPDSPTMQSNPLASASSRSKPLTEDDDPPFEMNPLFMHFSPEGLDDTDLETLDDNPLAAQAQQRGGAGAAEPEPADDMEFEQNPLCMLSS